MESKLLSKRPSLGEALLECVPIKVDEYSANLPPPSYGSVPHSRGGRSSPLSYPQTSSGREIRGQSESHYGALPPSRGEIGSQVVRSNQGRYPEDTYYGVIPPSRGGKTSPLNYSAPPPSRGGRISPTYSSYKSKFTRAKTIDINTATLQLLSTATQTDSYLLPTRSRLE